MLSQPRKAEAEAIGVKGSSINLGYWEVDWRRLLSHRVATSKWTSHGALHRAQGGRDVVRAETERDFSN